ncbi:hAT transposon superfamily [Cinnamomum micranthum f. kanehirae]|uniref:HAT transposon superfamily n=1 Tax=Cinnamomum micranthum f. kanehirae TaxID=337451 RepID=A0A443PB81_9MAGN|nr:hAT transposon superfamily [Cinnamomum micranthum f. kanehirae]
MKIGLPWAICTKQWIEQKRQSRRILIKDEEYEEKEIGLHHQEINTALNEAVGRLEPDERNQELIIKQFDSYKNAIGQFGANLAKRNKLEHNRLNDLVFVLYSLKLQERYQFRRTSSRSDPISLENIDILLDWVCKEPALMTEEDVRGWEFVEQPAQMIVGADERTPSFEDLCAFFRNRTSELTGTPECSTRRPNWNDDQNEIDNYGVESFIFLVTLRILPVKTLYVATIPKR